MSLATLWLLAQTDPYLGTAALITAIGGVILGWRQLDKARSAAEAATKDSASASAQAGTALVTATEVGKRTDLVAQQTGAFSGMTSQVNEISAQMVRMAGIQAEQNRAHAVALADSEARTAECEKREARLHQRLGELEDQHRGEMKDLRETLRRVELVVASMPGGRTVAPTHAEEPEG